MMPSVSRVVCALSHPHDAVIHSNTVSPYPARHLTNINQEDPALVLGSRLSALDALVQLSAGRHKEYIKLIDGVAR